VSKAVENLTKLRDLPNEELQAALGKTRDDLFRLRLGQYTNQVTSSAELQSKRREIARIMTLLRARELGTETQQAGKAAPAPAAAATEEAPAKKTKAPRAAKTAEKTKKAKS
jgi:large subunit ribosomal protein L29